MEEVGRTRSRVGGERKEHWHWLFHRFYVRGVCVGLFDGIYFLQESKFSISSQEHFKVHI